MIEERNQVTWGPVAAIVATVAAFLLAQVIGVILLLLAATLIGGHGLNEATGAGSYLEEPGYIFLGNALISGCLFGLTYAYIRWRKSSLRAIGLKRWRRKDMVDALGGYAVYFLIFIAVNTIVRLLAPGWLDLNQDVGFSRSATGPVLALIFVSLVILPPLVEEIMFRGLLYSGLRKRLSFSQAALVTSFMFGFAHLFGGENGQILWLSAIDTFILSAVLCSLRERTGGLWAPILLHGTKNFIAFAMLFIFKVA